MTPGAKVASKAFMKFRGRLRALSAAVMLGVAVLATGVAQACSVAQTRALFDYKGRTQTILDVEAAMARAQTETEILLSPPVSQGG